MRGGGTAKLDLHPLKCSEKDEGLEDPIDDDDDDVVDDVAEGLWW